MSYPEYVSRENGFKIAAIITRTFAKTFYFASRFLPKEKKSAAFSLYAVCRMSDESVDNNNSLDTVQRLKKIKENIYSIYNGAKPQNSIWMAFKDTVDKYKIPAQYFYELIEGMHMDLNKNRYENMEELYNYCYKVASVVGLIMLKVLGYKDSRAEQYAVNLGVAMQLTNILRDIKEDFLRDRIYLPQDELKMYGISEDNISNEKIDENFRSFLKFKIDQARQYYIRSEAGIKIISDVRSRLVILVMKELYSGILNSIEKNNYDVFSRRAHLNNVQKTIDVLKIIFRGEYL
ncbi:MAG: phytoene/squalene synthase family protein [Candidatus Omnitrophica bacterium]|nr:phytoene/squalene synthase family protein [Candidatus Omnitrophota bacterium]